MASRPEPALRGVLRLLLAATLIGGGVGVFEDALAARLLAPLGACLGWIDGTFRTVDLGIATVNGEAVIRRVATPAALHAVGSQVVFADARTRITTSAGEGVLFQPVVFALTLLFAWPWRSARLLGLRVVAAVPLVLCLFLLDVPMVLYGASWYQEVALLDPDRFSPLILWMDFMNAGGRLALAVAAAALSVGVADRFLPSRPSPVPPGPPATALPGARPSRPADPAA
jgi:hypothetical protein